jgi:hypothetical protein
MNSADREEGSVIGGVGLSSVLPWRDTVVSLILLLCL